MANAPDEPLGTELRELGRWLDVPEPPDVRAAVRTRLTTATPARGRARRPIGRWLAAAAAVLVATVAVVPPARAAVVDAVSGLLRFAGVEFDEKGPQSLPTQPSPLPSIRSVSLDEARRLARFPVRTPARLGPPETVTVADPAPDGAPRVVTLTYRGGAVRLDQFDGELDLGFVKGTGNVTWVNFGGRLGIWVPQPHPVTYVDRNGVRHTEGARLAGPTLIWTIGTVTLRLEGVPTVEEAMAVAAST